MATSNKKGGPELEKLTGSDSAASANQAHRNNLFSRHGNQQITEVINQASASQEQEAELLQQLAGQENENQAESSWWQEEEQSQLAARNQDEESTRQQTPEQQNAQLQGVRAAMSGGELVAAEKAMLADAEKAGMTEDDKARMLISAGTVTAQVAREQSGEVQALLGAEKLPGSLAAMTRKAASETSDSPLNERDTIQNVTGELELIAQQIANYPSLNDPNLSIESKATQLVNLLASHLDIRTLESLAVHPYLGLVEDLVFDPQALLEINTIAGSNRNVRVMGAFSVSVWQLCVDSVRNRLNTLEDDQQVHESGIWSEQITAVSRNMVTDALRVPTF